MNIIQRLLGHANLGTTSIYLQGIDPEEIIATVHMRRGTDDVRQRRPAALRRISGSVPALPLRHGETSVRTPRSGQAILVRSGCELRASRDARISGGAGFWFTAPRAVARWRTQFDRPRVLGDTVIRHAGCRR